MAPKRKETEATTPKRTTRSSSAATTKKAKTTPSRSTATADTSGGAKKKGKALKIGDSVVDVDAKLTLNDETKVSLKELCKDEGIVIFMYPRYVLCYYSNMNTNVSNYFVGCSAIFHEKFRLK